MCSQKAFLYIYIFLINMTPLMRSIFRNLRLNAQQHSGLKGSDLFLRFLPFFPLLLLLLLAVGLFSSYFHTWETSFTPYLVFSHCSNPNNEPTRHSKWGRKKKRGKPGTKLYKVAEEHLPCRLHRVSLMEEGGGGREGEGETRSASSGNLEGGGGVH